MTETDSFPSVPTGHAVPAGPVGAPLPYHRLARLTPSSARWWRPLLVVLLAAVLAGVGFVAVLVVIFLAGIIPGLPHPTEELEDPRNPMDMVFSLGLLAIGVPAVALAARWAGRRRGDAAGTLHSVAGRFRWGLLARAATIVLPVFALVNLATFLLMPPDDVSAPPMGASLIAVYAVIVLVTPLQCAAEEYVFRALPQQLLGTWLRSPAWGILLPIPLFVLGHEYGWVGQIDIAVFALCMGLLAWKTGGIELPILVHTANNLTLFLLAPFSPSALQQGSEDPILLAFSLPMTVLVTLGLSLWVSRREGVGVLEPVRGRGRQGALSRPAAPRPVRAVPA